MKILNIISDVLEENSYLIFDESEKIAVIIDPGSDAKKYQEEIESRKLKLEYIVLTHCHHDHTRGVEGIKKIYKDVKVCIHEKDFNGLLSPLVSHAKYKLKANVSLKDGDLIEFGSFSLKTINTPGHTKGSSCFELFDQYKKSMNMMFTGDALFLDDIGRWDLATGSEYDSKNSIRNIMSTWAGIVKIHPGHGACGKMNKVRKVNNWYNDIVNKKI